MEQATAVHAPPTTRPISDLSFRSFRLFAVLLAPGCIAPGRISRNPTASRPPITSSDHVLPQSTCPHSSIWTCLYILWRLSTASLLPLTFLQSSYTSTFPTAYPPARISKTNTCRIGLSDWSAFSCRYVVGHMLKLPWQFPPGSLPLAMRLM